jgi:ATP/maltotriose-dependent transcriptional regulator MalT
MTWLGVALTLGATPVPEATRRIEELLTQVRGSRAVEALLLASLAELRAMEGRTADARDLLERARGAVDDLGYLAQLAVVPFYGGVTELLADDPHAAEQTLRPALQPLEQMGETSTYCSIVAVLAQAVYVQGRYEEAEELTRLSEQKARLNDVHAQVTWRSVRIKALARRGEVAEAQGLAQEALAFARDSDFLNAHGTALLDLAEVHRIAGRNAEAVPAVEEAVRLYEEKGNTVDAARAKAALAELRG